MTTKAELESKHLAELHERAAEAGVERYRMLSRAELIEKLAGGEPKAEPKPKGERGGEPGRGRQRDRGRKPREPRQERGEPRREPKPAPRREPAAAEPAAAAAPAPPKRKRRRRRWGRRRKGVRLHDLLLPAAPGRQVIVYAESRERCTALLREVAAELSAAADGPDPIALLVDPTPEELADWRREAPQVEIVAAGMAHHAGDAIAQARARAGAGGDVIVLVDSLTRFAESFAGAGEARELFDAGLGATGGTLTVVAALERPA
jgi:transcription termination factor Rho